MLTEMSNEKIVVTLSTSGPIHADEFANMINAYNKLFITNASNKHDTKAVLAVSEIRKGSFEVVFSILAEPSIQAYIKSSLEAITYGILTDIIIKAFSKNPIKNNIEALNTKEVRAIIAPMRNNPNSTQNITHINGDKIINNFNIYFQDVDSATKNISEKLQDYDNTRIETIEHQHQVTMRWKQTNFDNPATGNQAIISSISDKKHKVTFNNPQLKQTLTSNNPNYPDKSWQDLTYIVDVDIIKIDKKIKYYRIINIYPELTED